MGRADSDCNPADRTTHAELAHGLGVDRVAGGMRQAGGVIFEPPAVPISMAEPPEQPRMRYVGQLVTSADLKPAVRLDRPWAKRCSARSRRSRC